MNVISSALPIAQWHKKDPLFTATQSCFLGISSHYSLWKWRRSDTFSAPTKWIKMPLKMCKNVIRDRVTIYISRVVCSMELRQPINHIPGRLIHCQCMVVKYRHSSAGTVERSLYVFHLSRSKNITEFAHCTKDALMGAYQNFNFRLYYQCLPKSTPKKSHSYFMS